MPRIEKYGKKYRWTPNLDPEARGARIADENDTILEKLKERCFEFPSNESNINLLLYFNRKTMIKIRVARLDYNPALYTREVSLEILPSDAKTPKELSDLFKEKRFEKRD